MDRGALKRSTRKVVSIDMLWSLTGPRRRRNAGDDMRRRRNDGEHGRPDARTMVVLALVVLALAVAAVPALSQGQSAKAAGGPSSTFTLVLSNSATGTAPFDAPASCTPALRVANDVIPTSANSTGTAHCAGMDHSASDNIVRALDTVDVKVDWQLVLAAGAFQIGGQPADSNLTVTMTLPLAANGQPLATWTGIPGACYITSSGVNPTITPLSALSNANRTLTCNIGHKIQGNANNFIATYRTSGYATDGTRIDLQANIQADTTRAQANPATNSNTLTDWSSANSNYNLRLDQAGFALTTNTPGPGNEAGRLLTLTAQTVQPKGTESIGISTCCGNGNPHFSFDIDLSRFGNVASADDGGATQLWQRARLYTWAGSNGFGTNSTNYHANQTTPGGPIHVDVWTFNTGVVTPNTTGSLNIYVWLPNAAIPVTNTTVTAALTGFDPTTMAGPNFASGQSNYGGSGEACLQVPNGQANPANCEPGLVRSATPASHAAANDNEYYLTTLTQYQPPALVHLNIEQSFFLNDGDIRSGSYNTGTYATNNSNYGTTQLLAPSGNYSDTNVTVLPGTQILAASSLKNTGTLTNNSPAVCSKWDNRTEKLTDFGDASKPVAGGAKFGNSAFVANTWGIVLTTGGYHPGAKWNTATTPYNNAHPLNYEADPASYTLQFGVGEWTPADAPMTQMNVTSCRDQDSAAGWFTNPNDPAIQTWINNTYGAGSGITPLDVVNRVRVTFNDAIPAGASIDLVVRVTVRSTWGPTTTGGVAGTIEPSGTRIAMMGAFTDEYIVSLGNNGTTRRNNWLVGNYRPDTDAGSYGDRATLGHVDMKGATYTMWPSPQGLNSITSVIAGQEVWVRFDPYVYSASGVPTGTPAYPTRMITWLPPQLTYVPSSGCRVTTTYQYASCASPQEPVIVNNVDGLGGTALVWDLGTYVPDAGTARPAIEFRTTVDTLSNNGVVARIADVIESKNGDGTTNTQLPVCNSLTQVTNLSIPATTNGPAEVLGVDRACAAYRESAQSVTIFNANGLVYSGRTAQQQIEVNDADDGTGTLVAYTVTTKNFNSTATNWTDQIIQLPWNGDGRRPASAYHGSITMQGVSTSDVLSPVNTPNALPVDWTNPPARNGTTFYWTSVAPASVNEDPGDPSNLAGGATQWCTTAQLGNAGCPANMAAATALRVISGSLAGNGTSRTVTVRYSTSGNQRLDVYSMHSIARSGGYALLLRSVDTSMTVVDSSLGGTLWVDSNSDGFMQVGENVRLLGVRVNLYGGSNNFLTSQLTDGAGTFNFSGLHSGTYTVKVVATNGIDGQVDLYPALANDYDTDSGSVNSGGHPDMQATFVVARNVQRTDAVFGFATTTLSGKAWRDDNRDGLVDPGEISLPNKTITLTGVDDLGHNVNLSTTTDINGLYTFPNLRPGTYTVTETAPVGSVQPYAGSAGGTVNGLSIQNITLLGGMTATNYKFATIAPSVAMTLWVDPNQNLSVDPGEHGIPNVHGRISSKDNTTQVVTSDSSTTDVNGQESLYS
jgi:hypothetical protein